MIEKLLDCVHPSASVDVSVDFIELHVINPFW